MFVKILTIIVLISLVDCNPRRPRIYNAVITSSENLQSSKAYPIIQPVVQPASYAYQIHLPYLANRVFHTVSSSYFNEPSYNNEHILHLGQTLSTDANTESVQEQTQDFLGREVIKINSNTQHPINNPDSETEYNKSEGVQASTVLKACLENCQVLQQFYNNYPRYKNPNNVIKLSKYIQNDPGNKFEEHNQAFEYYHEKVNASETKSLITPYHQKQSGGPSLVTPQYQVPDKFDSEKRATSDYHTSSSLTSPKYQPNNFSGSSPVTFSSTESSRPIQGNYQLPKTFKVPHISLVNQINLEHSHYQGSQQSLIGQAEIPQLSLVNQINLSRNNPRSLVASQMNIVPQQSFGPSSVFSNSQNKEHRHDAISSRSHQQENKEIAEIPRNVPVMPQFGDILNNNYRHKYRNIPDVPPPPLPSVGRKSDARSSNVTEYYH